MKLISTQIKSKMFCLLLLTHFQNTVHHKLLQPTTTEYSHWDITTHTTYECTHLRPSIRREKTYLSTARSIAHKRSIVPHFCKELAMKLWERRRGEHLLQLFLICELANPENNKTGMLWLVVFSLSRKPNAI